MHTHTPAEDVSPPPPDPADALRRLAEALSYRVTPPGAQIVVDVDELRDALRYLIAVPGSAGLLAPALVPGVLEGATL